VSRDGGRTYPAGCEQALPAVLPNQPAAVLLYDAAGAARCLAADFDVAKGGQAQVDHDAAAFTALIAACGGNTFADVSPTGGRHVYVPWSRPLPIGELRPVMRALAVLYPSLDATPMLNPTAGCIRPPGARHRRGGHQNLTTPLEAAVQAVRAPCGPRVWAALLDRLAPQLRDLDTPTTPGTEAPDPEYEPATPRARTRLSARVTCIAETGLYDLQRYASASEARQAVIAAAAAAGWAFTDVAAQIERGLWPGLASLYSRYRPHTRRAALTRDWRKATTYLDGRKTARNSPTREWTHTGVPQVRHSTNTTTAAVPTAGDGEYGWIRSWWNGIAALERIRWQDRAGLSKRLVLRALGAMAQMRGSRHLDVGRRGLALACGLDDSTVSAVLRALREEDDAVIELLQADRGERGDLYTLRIPDAALEAAAWRRWRPGLITVHPVFRALGAASALVYEALSGDPLPRRAVTHDAGLPPRTVDEALRTLAEHGLAERAAEGWHRGPVHPDRVADALGVPAMVNGLITRYRVERAAWRALLDARANLGSSPAPRGGEPLLWHLPLTAPPPTHDDDELYDQVSAAVDQLNEALTSAVTLLERELGATVLARSG
jgi:hypothetical protein